MNVYTCGHCDSEVITSAELACCPVCEGAGLDSVASGDTERLRRFARRIMQAWPESGVNGGELQDAAVDCGLLKRVTPAPLEPCGPSCVCADYYAFAPDKFAAGKVKCYRPTAVLTGDSQSGSNTEQTDTPCTCHACITQYDLRGADGVLPVSATRMIVCPDCGNKRCPHASDHRLACSGPNAPDQLGSLYATRFTTEE